MLENSIFYIIFQFFVFKERQIRLECHTKLQVG